MKQTEEQEKGEEALKSKGPKLNYTVRIRKPPEEPFSSLKPFSSFWGARSWE